MAQPKIYYGPGGSYQNPDPKKKTFAEEAAMLAAAVNKPTKLAPSVQQITGPQSQSASVQLAAAVSKPATPAPTVQKAVSPAPTSAAMQLAAATQKPVTMQPTATAQNTGSLITSRQYSPQLQTLLDNYSKAINAAPVTSQDIVNSAEYQDLAKGIQFQADKAQAGLLRGLASRNMLRSDRGNLNAASLEGAYQAQMAGLVPQLMQTAQARQQQSLANLGNLLGTVSGLENTAFNQGATEFGAGRQVLNEDRTFDLNKINSDRSFALNEASVTGQYQPQAVAQMLQSVFNAKKSWADENDGTTKAQDEAAANAARQALSGYGFSKERIDELVGSGVTLEQAQANLNQFSVPTMQAKQNEAQMFGTVGGQQTLQGQAAQQQLAVGQLELKRQQLQSELDADPNIGTRAQKQKELEALDAQIANTYANIANTQSIIDARNAEAAQPKAPKIDRLYIQNTYGINPGLTSNYVAFDESVNQLLQWVGTGEMTFDDYREYLETNDRALRAAGLDTGALLDVASRLLTDAPPSDSGAKKAFMLGEKTTR